MYPYELFWGLDLYSICLLVGVISSFVVFRICADRRGFSPRMQNLVLFDAFASVVGGYLGAVFFQAVYNYLGDPSKGFKITRNTGATFMGGLITGVLLFFIVYFIAGHFLFKDREREHINRLWELVSIGAAAIAGAHAFGRIGCFFAGCCYGIETDSFLGVTFVGQHVKRLPVQLFESAFLFVLCGVLLFLNLKKKDFIFAMPIYMVSYGIWRYLIEEFLRGDFTERGGKIFGVFWPSQFTSLLMFAGGIALGAFLLVKINGKRKKAADN